MLYKLEEKALLRKVHKTLVRIDTLLKLFGFRAGVNVFIGVTKSIHTSHTGRPPWRARTIGIHTNANSATWQIVPRGHVAAPTTREHKTLSALLGLAGRERNIWYPTGRSA